MTPRPGAAWKEALAVGLAAVLVLVAAAPAYGLDHIYLTGYLNDQVGYITTARWLADTGELRSHLIYPAYADQEGWRLYMPGHYYLLAAVFKLFGYGPLLARIPSLAAFVLGVVGVFLIGRRLYGRGAGLVAAALYAVLPLQGYFAFSAMADLTVTASVVLAFLLFLQVPERWRAVATPFLLVLPFLFRETTAFVVIPMSLLVLGPGPRRRWGGFLLAGLGSVLMLSAVNRWQIASGKEPAPLSWVTSGEFNYDDATALDEPPPEASEWLSGLVANTRNNLSQLADRYTEEILASPAPLSSATLLAVGALLLVHGLRRRREDMFPLGAGLLTATIALLVVTSYSVWALRFLRTLHVALPFLVVGVGSLAGPRLEAWLAGGASPRLRVAGFAALAMALSVGGLLLSAAMIDQSDPTPRVERIESIAHDDSKVLVGPHAIVFDYVLAHYPVRYSFRPENPETLRLLFAHHDVGTVIVTGKNLKERFTPRDLRELGLENKGKLPLGPGRPAYFQ